ncbi:type II CRISPR-associated endonuclease Cas1 [Ructibacterium gallinarum]|uniref:CRISPR-associated endonuclease Cas1 n=1 Tax=Ructibacterium gallinarum TaxID=2779355 RepID=A0A9D5LYZ2_9FIRM|nr:type II CRISPR-associated endonuclease Cas1 [Ructibacterium gallinarum]MBE5040621.1 type II CRISPR-associated endonuclease Cas1 [Ructibacterium gallinarum]
MSWRTVVITRRCKLDLKMNYLVVRAEEGVSRVFLDEIGTLLIENTAVSITGCLLAELAAKKIKVIFCDGKRNPCAELVPCYGSHDCSRKLEQQIGWKSAVKDMIWSEIVAEKIRKQAIHLRERDRQEEAALLERYLMEIEPADASNREGHAAKVYFNALFGKDFTRAEDNAVNAALNYGYSILLSACSREIVANGYLTQLGIFHHNMFNAFNLSCDLVEPFRILVDRVVKTEDFRIFDQEARKKLVNILNDQVKIDGTVQYVNQAIKIYCKSVLDALSENDVSLIKFYSYEL